MKRTAIAKLASLAVVAFTVFSLLGCTTVNYESSLNKSMISMSGFTPRDYDIVHHFKYSTRAYFTIDGLITLSRPDIDAHIQQELDRYKGDAVINLKMSDQYGGIDILLNMGLSLGGYLVGYSVGGSDPYTQIAAASLLASVFTFFLQSRTVTVEGDVIRYKSEPAASGPSPDGTKAS